MSRPALGKFVGIDDDDSPDLLTRMTNDALSMDSERYGIQSRLILNPGASLTDLAESMVRKLCHTTQIQLDAIGGIVLSSRNLEIESEAARLQSRLAATCRVYGIERACSGFPAGVRLAMHHAADCRAPVAVVAVETISRNINWEIPDGSPQDQSRARGQAAKLFGDGAAAVLVNPETTTSTHEIIDAWSSEVADPHQLLQKVDIVDACDPWQRPIPGTTTCISMPGRRGFLLLKRAPELMVEALEKTMRRANLDGRIGPQETLSDVIPHQANGLMIPRIQQGLAEMPWAVGVKVHDRIAHHGNTVSATIPLAMAEVQAKLKPGSLVAMPSVGAGGPGYRPDVLSVGCVLIRVGK